MAPGWQQTPILSRVYELIILGVATQRFKIARTLYFLRLLLDSLSSQSSVFPVSSLALFPETDTASRPAFIDLT